MRDRLFAITCILGGAALARADAGKSSDMPDRFPVEVMIALRADHTPVDAKLAGVVKEKLLELKPKNPGRKKSFPRMESKHAGRVTPLTQTGWVLQVAGVKPIPGGWRAKVNVFPRVKFPGGGRLSVYNHHIEFYKFREGKLVMESDMVDPTCDPKDGLWGFVVGG